MGFVESLALANLVRGLVTYYDNHLQYITIYLLKHHMYNKANIEECRKLIQKDVRLTSFLFSEKTDSIYKHKISKSDEIYNFLLMLNDSQTNRIKDEIQEDINKLLADTKFKKDALDKEQLLNERRNKIRHKYNTFFIENKAKVD